MDNSGTVNEVIYTKRTAADIKADPSLAATARTSGITDMISLFSSETSFDEDMSHWDVSRFGGRFMNVVFQNATNFNQDLTGWCIDDVSSESTDFSVGGALPEVNKPIWGTCLL